MFLRHTYKYIKMKGKICLSFFSCLLLQTSVLISKINAIDTNMLWSVRMAESAIIDGAYQGISYYVDATAMKSFRNLWLATGDTIYLQYIIDAVDDDLSYYYEKANAEFHDIDPVNGGSLILFMFSQTGELKYQSAADSLLKFLKAFPRTSGGGFYHKDSPHMQVDDLYMGSPFLAEYGKVFNRQEELDDAVKQAILMEKHTRDSITGLYYHVWYEEVEGNFEAGCNPYSWGRGMGWVAMALVDILDFLPADYSGKDSVIAIFQRFAEAISQVQDTSTGLWWQVLDQGGKEGNFLESSASGMFIYSLAKGIRMGYIDLSYWEIVEKGYQGMLDYFIKENPDGTISITHVCPGQSPGIEYEHYAYVPQVENGHGLGPFIMASVEIELRGLPPSDLQTVVISDTKVNLLWKDNTDDEEGFIIERASGGDFSEIAIVPENKESFMDTSLTPLTKYTYRMRLYKGDTISFYSEYANAITIAENGAPAYASQPNPADGARSIKTDTTLSWLPGAATSSHDVYFGTTNPPPFVKNQTDSIFSPDTLKYSTTYYWQINELNSSGTTSGNIWSFTTKTLRGMVAHWKMDENSGFVLHDYSGNGNNGTLFNMSNEAWVPGIIEGALQFDGIDDYIMVPHNPSIDFGNQDFTISFWFKQLVTDRSMTYIIKGTHAYPGTGKRYEIFFDHLINEVCFEIDDNIGKPEDTTEISHSNYMTGEWVNIVAARLKLSDTPNIYSNCIYVNAELIILTFDEMGDISQNEDLYIGVSPDEDSTYFEGLLDDIRIFNYFLGPSEVDSIYNLEIEKNEENKVPFTLAYKPGLKNYPNPFNKNTKIIYSLSRKEKVKLSVYNIFGQEIEVLVDQIMPEGKHTVEFDASTLVNGTYVYKLQTESGIITNKMLYIK